MGFRASNLEIFFQTIKYLGLYSLLMQVHDYYSILELPPHASAQEIKRAYRRLAMLTHPDKNPHDPDALAKFQLIQEAYKVLSTPTLKTAYLSQRWYYKSTHKSFDPVLRTPDSFLKNLIALQEKYRFKSTYQIHYDLLVQELQPYTSGIPLTHLSDPQNASYRNVYVPTMLALLQLLPYRNAQSMLVNLKKTVADDQLLTGTIQKILSEKQRDHQWAKYKYLLVVIISAIIITWMILSRS